MLFKHVHYVINNKNKYEPLVIEYLRGVHPPLELKSLEKFHDMQIIYVYRFLIN